MDADQVRQIATEVLARNNAHRRAAGAIIALFVAFVCLAFTLFLAIVTGAWLIWVGFGCCVPCCFHQIFVARGFRRAATQWDAYMNQFHPAPQGDSNG